MTRTPAAGTGERSPQDGDDGGAFTVPLPLSTFKIKAPLMLPDGFKASENALYSLLTAINNFYSKL